MGFWIRSRVHHWTCITQYDVSNNNCRGSLATPGHPPNHGHTNLTSFVEKSSSSHQGHTKSTAKLLLLRPMKSGTILTSKAREAAPWKLEILCLRRDADQGLQTLQSYPSTELRRGLGRGLGSICKNCTTQDATLERPQIRVSWDQWQSM